MVIVIIVKIIMVIIIITVVRVVILGLRGFVFQASGAHHKDSLRPP